MIKLRSRAGAKMRYLWRILVVSTFLMSVTTLTTPTASASAPLNFCNGKSEESIVVTYRRGDLAIPLRCGSIKYGFRHLVDRKRWNAAFDSRVANTIARGGVNRTGSIYAEFDENCHETFRVMVNQGPIYGTGFRPQGVITAYERTSQMAVSMRTAALPAVEPRTCLIYEPVTEPH